MAEPRVDHTWPRQYEASYTMALRGKVMHVQVMTPDAARAGLVARLCFVSYCIGNGQKVVLGGRRPFIP